MRRMITDKLTKNIKEVVSAYQDGEIALTEDIPTKTSDLTNDSGFITASDVTQVVANPTLAGDEANLTGLQVGDTKYAVPQGGGSQKYAHSVMISGTNSTTGDTFTGVAYFISSDNTAITASNLIEKLIAAGYDATTKIIIFNGTIYSGTDTQYYALTYLAVQTNSLTNIRVGYASQGASVGNASITIDTTDADVTLNAVDTVI